MSEKPLFIPLQKKYFEAFKNGTKIDELRKYGARWNEYTCKIGREVIISKGYGNHDRMRGVITAFCKQKAHTLSDKYKEDIFFVYGTLEIDIAMIRIQELVSINEKCEAQN